MQEKPQTISDKDRHETWILLLILVAYFMLMGFPNAVGSEDARMVKIFEPDEGVPLPYVLDMIKPADSIKQALVNFIDYNYYFYGYPYFAYSAALLLPLKAAGALTQYPLIMLILRQMVSVLPVLGAIYLLVRAQRDREQRWFSFFLLAFLLAVPGVVRNNFWWHPDGLAVLAVVVTILLLNQDRFRFGKHFYWAAFFCGAATGVKYTGLYFFLTIGVYLIWGWVSKQIDFKKMVGRGLVFIFIMAAGVFLTNPLLYNASVRQDYFEVFQRESFLLSTGYNVSYGKGIQSGAPVIQEYFGTWIFIGVALFAPVLGILRKRDVLLNVLIITWVIPLTLFLLVSTHLKFQYLLPVALPLFSSLGVYFATLKDGKADPAVGGKRGQGWVVFSLFAVLVIGFQFVSYIRTDVEMYTARLQREATSPSIGFYHEAVQHLGPLPEEHLYVYSDVRIYVPDDSPWGLVTSFQLLTYDYIQSKNPAVLLLMEQRIRDYLNPDVEGIDSQELEISREFYRDADAGSIQGYHLVYRNDYGLAFVREDVYQQYLTP